MWMDLQCPNACGACLGECDDLKDECPGWAAKGECDTNPRFMVEQCPASCDLCPRLQGEALECDSCILMQEAIWRALQPIDRDIEEDPHKSVAEHRLHKRRKSDVIEKADVRRAVGDVCFSHEWLSRSPRRPYHTSCETTVSTRFHDIEAAWLKAVEEPPIDPHAPKIPVPNHPHEKVLQPKPPRLIRPSRTVALAVKRQLCVGNRDHHGHTRSHNEAAGHTDTLGTCNAQRARTLLGMGAPPLKGGACEICRTFVGDAVAVLRRTGLQLRPSGHTGAASPASYKRAVAQLEGVCADFELRHNVSTSDEKAPLGAAALAGSAGGAGGGAAALRSSSGRGRIQAIVSECEAMVRTHYDELMALTYQWARPDVSPTACIHSLEVCADDSGGATVPRHDEL